MHKADIFARCKDPSVNESRHTPNAAWAFSIRRKNTQRNSSPNIYSGTETLRVASGISVTLWCLGSVLGLLEACGGMSDVEARILDGVKTRRFIRVQVAIRCRGVSVPTQ